MAATFIILAISITALSIAVVAMIFWWGYRLGHRAGARVGWDAAAEELLLIKDPDAWDKSRYLQVEKRQREHDATTRISRIPKP